jgi:DNA sulfur modification protein DndC
MKQATFFDAQRLTLDDAQALTIQSLIAYGSAYEHWAVAWSGGKDSTATVTFLVNAIETGLLTRPKSLTVLYVDTRLELVPLAEAAKRIAKQLARRPWIRVVTVMAEMDKRFMVYVLGRGVPPPNNNTLRWCTRQIKVEPMWADLGRIVGDVGKVLMITGVRQGESAVRDQRIAMSCGKDGAECGQGWFQQTAPEALCDTLAPLLHWRVCHVWDWLTLFAPSAEWGGWDTSMIAEAYGGDEAREKQTRTGCNGCPLVQEDVALDSLIEMDGGRWGYLAPLKKLRPLWRELRQPHHRLRKAGGETRADGTPVKNQHRMGPILLESRRWALEVVISIQAECNAGADGVERPFVDILNDEEASRIRELIAARTWPRKWTGDEPMATEYFEDKGQASLIPELSAALEAA